VKPGMTLCAVAIACGVSIHAMNGNHFETHAQRAHDLGKAADESLSRYPPEGEWQLPFIDELPPVRLQRLPFTVVEPSGVKRTAWPVRCSVPLPRGVLRDERRVRLIDDAGRTVAVQSRPTCYWIGTDGRRFDAGIKFLLLEFLVDLEPDQVKQYVLEYGTDVPEYQRSTVPIDQTYRRTCLVNGPWTFRVAMHGDRILDSIEYRDQPISDGGLAAVLSYSVSQVTGVPMDEQQVAELNREPETEPSSAVHTAALRIGYISVVESGPVQTTLCIRGEYVGKHRDKPPPDQPSEPIGVTFPVTIHARFFNGSDYVQLFHTVVYSGIPVKHYWRSYGLTLALPNTRRAAVAALPADALPFAHRLRATPETAIHDADTPLVVRQVGPEAIEWANRSPQQTGRLAGRIAATNGQHTVALAVRDAWQNHPISFRANDHAVGTDLLGPGPGEFLDLRYPARERISRIYGMGSASAHGIQKTHEAWLWLSPGQADLTEALDRLAGVDQPVLVHLDPAYVAGTKALGHVTAYAENPTFTLLERKIRQYLEYPIFLRNHLKLYGFLNWGDQPSAPLVRNGQITFPNRGGEGWNNGEKTLSAYWFHWWMTGRRRYFDYGAAYVRHLVDIDTFHAGPYAGMGTRHPQVHWASPSEARQSSFRGMMQHFWITGDLVTLDSLRQTMDWMDREIWTRGYVGTKGGPFLYPGLLWFQTTGDTRFGPLMVRPMVRMALEMGRAGIRMPYSPYYRIINPRSPQARVMWREETPLPDALGGPEGYWTGYGWDDFALEWVELTGDGQAAEMLLRAAAAQEADGWSGFRSYHNPERFEAFTYLVTGSATALQDLKQRHWQRLGAALPPLPESGGYRAADFFKIDYTPSGRNAVLIDSAHPREIPYQLYALGVAQKRGDLDLADWAKQNR